MLALDTLRDNFIVNTIMELEISEVIAASSFAPFARVVPRACVRAVAFRPAIAAGVGSSLDRRH